MRAVGLVGGKMGAVDRGGGLHPIGKMRRGVDRISAAHAVADRTDEVVARGGLAIGIGEQRPRILHHQGNVDRGHQFEHPLALRRLRVRRQRPKLHHAGAVIQIGQHHIIARSREPACHVAQFLADRRRIHVEQDDGMRTAALGMADEGGGVAVLGGNFDLLVDHWLFFVGCDFWSGGRGIRLQGNRNMTRRSKPAGTGLEPRRRDRHCVGGAILTPPTGDSIR